MRKMTKALALGLLVTFSTGGIETVTAQSGKSFPPLTGEMLSGKEAQLPNDYSGKMTLVGMAWSRKAEDALKSWYEPLYDKFVAKRGIFDSDYDIQLCLIPMYIGLKQTAYDATLKELRKSNRQDLFPYILFYRGELEPYESQLGLKDKTLPYFFLLDKKGKIIHHFSGEFSDDKLEVLEEKIEKN